MTAATKLSQNMNTQNGNTESTVTKSLNIVLNLIIVDKFLKRLLEITYPKYMNFLCIE